MKSNHIIADSHTHSLHSHDSQARIYDMAQSAVSKNLKIMAVTDHCDVIFCKKQDVKTPVKEAYDEVQKLKVVFDGKLEILSGVEISEGFWYESDMHEVIKMCDYDVVIGSVHSVRYKGLDFPYSKIDFSLLDEDTIYEFLSAYYNDVETLVKTTPCDIITHLTCPLRYINGKYKRNIDNSRFLEKTESILKLIIQKGLALEINTSGINGMLDDFMPDRGIIKMYKDSGGEIITIGSDAHAPQNVANGFDKALNVLKECGFNGYYYYKKRKAEKIEIGDKI